MSIAKHDLSQAPVGEVVAVRAAQRLDESQEAERKRQIEAVAHRQLAQSSYPVVREVDCIYEAGVLTLRGRVPSYYLKQIAQTLVLDRLEGVVKINNQLVVQKS